MNFADSDLLCAPRLFLVKCWKPFALMHSRSAAPMIHGITLSMLLLVQMPAFAQNSETSFDALIQRTVDHVYQSRYKDFAHETEQFLSVSHSSCQLDAVELPSEQRDRFEHLVIAFSGIELYRTGPLLEENRQNRLFFWPDKRRAGERQLRALLNDASSATLTEIQLAEKSVAVQGLPALERLLFGKSASSQFANENKQRYCQVLLAIAQNMNTMATSLNTGWSSETEFVKSMYKPEVNSAYFRTEDEVLSSIVTQIIAGIDVLLDRKITPLSIANTRSHSAPLWLSEQTINMLKGNMNSLQALIIESGLAAKAKLEDELAFEFRTANAMLQSLEELPTLFNDSKQLNEDARSLFQSLASVTNGIAYTLNDRFVQNLNIRAGFNSDDGD